MPTTKRKPPFPVYILAALLGLAVLVSLVVLYALDRSLIARTANQRDAVSSSATNNIQGTGLGVSTRATTIFELAPKANSALGGDVDIDSIGNGEINASNAREALRNAPTKTIQGAIKAKTGKTVGLDKIEAARQKALSSDGQRKINEALKRRDEVDISKIREKLQ